MKIEIDPEKLYYNMVEAKAEWLYGLPQWDSILTEEKKKELYKKQKASGTIVKVPKIGRNDPCPCGSGKKYKKCCGKERIVTQTDTLHVMCGVFDCQKEERTMGGLYRFCRGV